MKHQMQSARADRVGQVQITFTNKQLMTWGGACSVVAKFLERIGFREWVLAQVPVEERLPNAKSIYEKVLALLLTSLTGGTRLAPRPRRFSHVTGWSHGMEGLKACFGVKWLLEAASVLRRFWGKFRQRHNEGLRAAAAGLAGRLIEAEAIREDTLILYSTVCERYGTQEGARKGYNPKKPGRPTHAVAGRGHHPLKVGLGSGYAVKPVEPAGRYPYGRPCGSGFKTAVYAPRSATGCNGFSASNRGCSTAMRLLCRQPSRGDFRRI